MAQSSFSRLAKARENPGGMCCVITIAGRRLPAIASAREAIASVPPVEAPIAITVSRPAAVRHCNELTERRLRLRRRDADGAGLRTRRGRGPDLLAARVLSQFADRIRSAGFGQNLDGAEFQRLDRGPAGRLRQAN